MKALVKRALQVLSVEAKALTAVSYYVNSVLALVVAKEGREDGWSVHDSGG